MNAERLNIIALTLRRELDERNALGHLETLASTCQQLGQNPGNTSVQQNYQNARSSFLNAVTETPSDAFAPAWRQILSEIGGEDLFGRRLKEHVERTLAENQPTLSVAYQKLNEISSQLRAFRESLTRLTDSLRELQIGAEALSPGEAEIALLIPRDDSSEKLADFTSELAKMKFILNTFSEVATGQIEDLKIRTISSSGLMVFLAAGIVFAGMIARVVERIVGTYKKILDIKKVQLEITRLQMPDDISEKAKDYANNLMKDAIDKFTLEIIQDYPIQKADARKNELTTAVRISLDMVANRIDRGFNFEVRIEPPKVSPKDPESEKKVNLAIQSIKSAALNMQYMKLEGPPILALPENTEAPEQPDAKLVGERKHRKIRTIED